MYIFLFLLSFALTYFIKEIAIKKSLVADVNERSSHTTPTPHGGGIAIAVSWFIGITYFYFTDGMSTPLYVALMVGVIISLVSYLDDLFELSPKVRLLTQAIVAFVALYSLGGLEQINLFFFTLENQIVTNIFAFFMIIWFINLYNFLDGIDGYAGSETLFLALAGCTLFGGEHFIVLAVAVLGFLLWNWQQAKIFMGDVGSTLLGYNVAIFTIYYTNQESTNFWIWIILFGVFWFDATVTLYRRFRNKERLSQAHKKHAYQRLVQSGWRHDRVVISSLLVNLLLFVIIYFMGVNLLSFVVTCALLYGCIKFVDSKKGFA